MRIILFDGTCILCNTSVRWIIAHDRRAYFHFAALQSDAAEVLLASFGCKAADMHSVVLIEGDQVFTASTAVLEIAKNLDFPWSLLAWFRIVPRWPRDVLYEYIAAHRYAWFGARSLCAIPNEFERERFL